jgi:CBS domain containing-hemolysin-like protein
VTGADTPLIVLFLVAFFVSVFVAAGETAFLRMPAVRVEALAAEGSRSAKRLAALSSRLSAVLNAILLVALLSQISAATIAGILASRWFPGGVGVTISSVVLTLVLFVYSEAIPKTFAVRHADRVALALAYPLSWLELIVRPVVAVLVWVADLQMPGKGVVTSPTVTEDELRMLAGRAATEGEITSEDLHLIERAFRVGDREVDDIMVPRPEIVAVEESTTVDVALQIALGSGHRRLPVFSGSLENVKGMVRLRDMVAVPDEKRGGLPVVRLAERTLVVPETKRVLDLLGEMQSTGVHLAVVVDEYGGTAGLVTVEDIAEELLGSISEQPTTKEIVQLATGRWTIDGSLPVEDFGDLIGLEIPDADVNTVAGLVLSLLGRIPHVGDSVSIHGHNVRVTAVRGRRITRVEAVRGNEHEDSTPD